MPRRYDKSLKDMTKNSGVYALVNVKNSKSYIGSALCIRGRLHQHRSSLRRGKHDNRYLQRAWDNHGEEFFVFKVLEECDSSKIVEREQYWLDYYKSYDRNLGYNLCPVANGSMSGLKHTEKQKAKWSNMRKGCDTSKATRAAAEANRGKPRPESVRRKISDAHKGKQFTDEHKRNLKSAHWSKGQNATDIVEKVASKNRGRKHTMEHRRKISESNKLRWQKIKCGILHATTS